MTSVCTEVYAVRAVMVDGAAVDLLLFFEHTDAEKHAEYIRGKCGLLGFDSIHVVARRVIGQEAVERRTPERGYSEPKRRRSDARSDD